MMANNSHFSSGSTKPPLKSGVLRCYSMKFCPFGQRTLLALQAKKIPHEIVYVDLKNKPQWFLDLTPTSLVPVLEMDGQIIVESIVTMEFLDDLYPEYPLQHRDPWKKFTDKYLIDVFSSKVLNSLKKLLHVALDVQEKQQLFTQLLNGLDFFEVELKNRKTTYYGGMKPGLLDYANWAWFERIPVLDILDNLQIPEDRFPILIQYMNNMMKDESVQNIHIEPKYYAEFLSEVRHKQTRYYDLPTNQKINNFVKYP